MEKRIFYKNPCPEFKKKSSCNSSSNNKTINKKKVDFKQKKNNTLKSLNEVEYFLNNFTKFKRYLHLYKFFK